MHRPDFHNYFEPHALRELTGIAGDDLMNGNWRRGVNDPRTALDELRRWWYDEVDGQQPNVEDLYDNGVDLIQMALGSAVIGDLKNDSPTLRYIFATIEKRESYKVKDDLMPGPFFVEALQILLLAAKPHQRKELTNAVLAATGMPEYIV